MSTLIASIDSDIGMALYRKLPDAHTTSRLDNGTYHMDVLDNVPKFTQQYDKLFYTIAADNPKEVIRVNAVAVYQLLDMMAKTKVLTDNAQVIVLSSQMGSIAEINADNSPYYRMSKAALNMGISILDQRYPNIRWKLLHPGPVRTKMTEGRTYSDTAMLEVDRCAELILERSKDNKPFGFYGIFGRIIPW